VVHFPKQEVHGAGDSQFKVFLGGEHVQDWRPLTRQSLDMFSVDRVGQRSGHRAGGPHRPV
jgi:hypothetical protein